MPKLLIQIMMALALVVGSPAIVPASAQPVADPARGVSVVVEVQLVSNSETAAAMNALNDIRAMMKKQPGFLSDVGLQNINPDNSPRYVHVSRWASMAHWSALFRAPEFARLSAHGNEHYTITASAFVPTE